MSSEFSFSSETKVDSSEKDAKNSKSYNSSKLATLYSLQI